MSTVKYRAPGTVLKKICPQCGKSFEIKHDEHAGRTYCDFRCRGKAARRRAETARYVKQFATVTIVR